jgi:sterol desaturase/sphingolipid hydroxylase (fatty acid hydroxylase superfamily)
VQLLISCVLAMLPIAAFGAICMLLEFILPRDGFCLRDRFPGLLFTIATPAFVMLAGYPLTSIWRSLGVHPVLDVTALGAVGAFVALLLLYDFLRYAEHRLEHAIWWPVHAVHHSETKLNSANSYGHPLMGVIEFFVVIVPLGVLTGTPSMLVASIMAVQNLVIHSPLRIHLGPLRRIFVDSRFHRIHHSMEPRHFGKNYGFLFTLWDQLLGTAYFPRDDEWPETGVAGLTPPVSLGEYLTHPLRHFSMGQRANR